MFNFLKIILADLRAKGDLRLKGGIVVIVIVISYRVILCLKRWM